MSDNPPASSSLLAEPRPGDNAPALTVSEISAKLKRLVEGEFGHVRLRGEISGFKRAASGHLYLALKDDKAVIDAVMWRGTAGRLAFAPEDGIEVIATGKLTTFPGRSKYQIVIEQLELAGEGALMQLFEKLKAKLGAEGLFDPERKQPLPFLPRTIGVVTSPTGAVIRDILHRLADRFPSHVLVWPVLVQGEGAAAQVARAIAGFDALDGSGPVPRPDLVIVARGGGSIEDLWAFNEEVVVRAIAACRIPLISAVGHETDTTLADYAADRRAPTPTAAAEMAVPVRAELALSIEETGLRGRRAIRRKLDLATERLAARAERLPRRADLLQPQAQRLDELHERLRGSLRLRLAEARNALAVSSGGLRPSLLARQGEEAARRLERLDWRPARLSRIVRQAGERFDAAARLFGQLHPDGPLRRGFARITDMAGATLTSAARASQEPRLEIRFADGAFSVQTEASANAMTSETRPKPPRPKRADESPSQPKLL